jgi:hypothetical protein
VFGEIWILIFLGGSSTPTSHCLWWSSIVTTLPAKILVDTRGIFTCSLDLFFSFSSSGIFGCCLFWCGKLHLT